MSKQKEIINEVVKITDKENVKKIYNDSKLENKNIRNIGLFLQFIFVILSGICSIMTIFINELLVVVEIMLGLTLLIMSYNNYKIYKHKGATWLYLLIGLILLVTSLYSYLGEI